MTLPFVSIIVVNYNLKRYLQELLEGLLQTEYPSFEIRFVDNASTDQSIEYVRDNFQDKRLAIIAFGDNLGLYKAQNLAAKNAEGEYICFLDADVKVGHNWLLPMVEAMVKDESVGAAQPSVMQMEDFSEAYLEETAGDKDNAEIREISFPRGACTLVRKKVFERLLGFNEDCFSRSGDRDFGWRIWLYGYRCVQVSAARIYHAGEKKNRDKKLMGAILYHQLKNWIAMELEFAEAKSLLKLMFLFLFRDLLRVKEGLSMDWKATLSAVLWVTRNMKLIMRKRSIIQNERKISDAVFWNKFPYALFILGRQSRSNWRHL